MNPTQSPSIAQGFKSKLTNSTNRPDYKNKFLQGVVNNTSAEAKKRMDKGTNVVSERKKMNDQLLQEIEQRLQELRTRHQYQGESGKFAFKSTKSRDNRTNSIKPMNSKRELANRKNKELKSVQVSPLRRDKYQKEIEEVVVMVLEEKSSANKMD